MHIGYTNAMNEIKARVRAYLALQAKAREDVWPRYREAVHAASTYTDAVRIDAALDNELTVLFGESPIHYIHSFRAYAHARMLAYFNYRCAYCNDLLAIDAWKYGPSACDAAYTPAFHIDHVHPKALGGANNYANFVPACRACNSSKRAKPLDDWISGLK